MGYLKDEPSSAALWAGGYLHTGDIGFIDAHGYLQVSDRIKDVIKTGGEWISSLDLEDILGPAPAVSEVAVIGVPDEKWGERPLALVVLRDGAPDDADAIRAFALDHAARGLISKYAVPDRILFVARARQDQRRQARQEGPQGSLPEMIWRRYGGTRGAALAVCCNASAVCPILPSNHRNSS